MFGHLKICTKAFEGNSEGEDLRQNLQMEYTTDISYTHRQLCVKTTL